MSAGGNIGELKARFEKNRQKTHPQEQAQKHSPSPEQNQELKARFEKRHPQEQEQKHSPSPEQLRARFEKRHPQEQEQKHSLSPEQLRARFEKDTKTHPQEQEQKHSPSPEQKWESHNSSSSSSADSPKDVSRQQLSKFLDSVMAQKSSPESVPRAVGSPSSSTKQKANSPYGRHSGSWQGMGSFDKDRTVTKKKEDAGTALAAVLAQKSSPESPKQKAYARNSGNWQGKGSFDREGSATATKNVEASSALAEILKSGSPKLSPGPGTHEDQSAAVGRPVPPQKPSPRFPQKDQSHGVAVARSPRITKLSNSFESSASEEECSLVREVPVPTSNGMRATAMEADEEETCELQRPVAPDVRLPSGDAKLRGSASGHKSKDDLLLDSKRKQVESLTCDALVSPCHESASKRPFSPPKKPSTVSAENTARSATDLSDNSRGTQNSQGKLPLMPKQAAGGTKPPVGGAKPPVGGAKPSVGGAKVPPVKPSAVVGVKPSTTGRPSTGGTKPSVGGTKPAVGGVKPKPAVSGVKPAVGGVNPKPAVGGVNPAVGGVKPKPAVGGIKPKPAVGGVKPKPAVGGVKPKPAVGGVNPAVGGVKPKPAVGGIKPKPAVGGVKLPEKRGPPPLPPLKATGKVSSHARPVPPAKPLAVGDPKNTSFDGRLERSVSPEAPSTRADSSSERNSEGKVDHSSSERNSEGKVDLESTLTSEQHEDLEATVVEQSTEWVMVDGEKTDPNTSRSPKKLPPSPIKLENKLQPSEKTETEAPSPSVDASVPLSPLQGSKEHVPHWSDPEVPKSVSQMKSFFSSPTSPLSRSPPGGSDIEPPKSPGPAVVRGVKSSGSSTPPLILFSSASVSKPSSSGSNEQGQAPQEEGEVSSRGNVDSGFISEVPDDLNLFRESSVESLVNSEDRMGMASPPLTPDVIDVEEEEEEAEKREEPEVWDEAKMEKARGKRLNIATELLETEKTYSGRIKVVAVDFYEVVRQYNVKSKQSIPESAVLQIFLNLRQIHQLSENILQDLQERMDTWSTNEALGDAICRLAPFLKLYAHYASGFEDAIKTLTECTKRDRKFDAAVREFERASILSGLGLASYMLEPVQRIPRYRLLLRDYLKYLPPLSPDRPHTQSALRIISEAADHSNDRIKELEISYVILSIQRSIVDYDGTLLAPHRSFIKKGTLLKSSRKTLSPRFFFLFSDILLHTYTPEKDVFKFKNEMPIFGMKVEDPKFSLTPFSFNIYSTTRSLILVACSDEEKQSWIKALQSVIRDDLKKRSSLRRDTNLLLDKASQLFGTKAPIMVPDKSVTMCQTCSSEFTMIFRRHHCRACGKVVCSNCSQQKAYLPYLVKIVRVCVLCSVESKNPDRVSEEETSPTHSPVGPRKQDGITNSGVLNLKAYEEDAVIAGYVYSQEGKKWNKMWYQIKRDCVLYKFKAHEDIKAVHSMPLPGYAVGSDPSHYTITLNHHSGMKNFCETFRVDDAATFENWLDAIRKVLRMEFDPPSTTQHTVVTSPLARDSRSFSASAEQSARPQSQSSYSSSRPNSFTTMSSTSSRTSSMREASPLVDANT